MTPRWPAPDVLSEIPADRHVVVEASAGTGKTFTIEHVVLRSVLAGEAIDRVLVLTFGEAAARELRGRVRSLLERARAVARGAAPQPDVPGAGLALDGEARARLDAALEGFERAPISTIHAFCQRVLVEYAFENGLGFEQRVAPGGEAVARAVRRTLRRGISRDRELARAVRAWLEDGTIAGLEDLVERSRRLRHPAVRRHLGIADDEARATFDRFFAGLSSALGPGALEDEIAALGGLQPFERDMLADALERARSPEGAKAIERLSSLVGLGDRRFSALSAAAPRRLRRVLLAALQRAELPPVTSPAAELLERVLPGALRELDTARATTGALDFEDLLFELARALSGPRGEALAARVAGRFDRALIDEFQDTDDVQWRIFERLFVSRAHGDAGPRLLVVGDPKQAIYAFRGADVFTYVEATTELAARGAATVALSRSFRSSEPMLRAVDDLLGREDDDPLLEGLIEHTVEVRAGNPAIRAVSAATGADVPPVVAFRLEASDEPLGARAFQELLARAYAVEIARLLGVRGEGDPLLVGDPPRRVAARDVFVLVRRSSEARLVAAELRARGVRVDVAVDVEVHRSREARELRAVLAALAEPEDRARALAAFATAFWAIPWTSLAELRGAGAEHPAYARLSALAELAAERRYPELFHALVHETGFAARAAALGAATDRANVEHVLALLAAELEERDRPVGELAALLSGWARGTRTPSARGAELALRTPDVEDAVRVLTMHRSKGLEAAVVFLLPTTTAARADAVAVVHEGFRRTLVLAEDQRDALAKEKLARERSDEEQRLLYVALTRARGRLYLPWVEPHALKQWAGPYLRLNARLARAATRPGAAGLFEVRALGEPAERREAPPEGRSAFAPPPELALPLPRRAPLPAVHAPALVTSYSALKQLAPEPDLGRPRPAPSPADPLEAGRALPRGAAVGSFLHGLLERLPFAVVAAAAEARDLADDPEALELARAVARAEGVGPELAPLGLALAHAALRAPLPFAGGARLVDLLHDKEVEILFPVPEASHPAWTRVGAAAEGFRAERGFVRGFVDLVVRVPEGDGGALWAVDYKSDLLEGYDAASLAAHVERHYELQRCVYAVGVARLARLERPPLRFGGMAFVFLRGSALHALPAQGEEEITGLERHLSSRVHQLDPGAA